MRHRQGRNRPHKDPHQAGPASEGGWLWGKHAVKAALENPKRRLKKMLVTPAALAEVEGALRKRGLAPQPADNDTIAKLLPRDAVHQGLALLADPLPELDIEDALAGTTGHRRLIMLDQVSDPHNLGAILRSAAAFGAAGVIVQDRHSPPVSGTLAKSASGAVEIVPLIRVVNLARTLDELGELGFLRLAFADEAAQPLNSADLRRDLVLVLGAEGEGLRRLTRERCDVAVRLPTNPKMPSLNVSNAAAVALYACTFAIVD
jgi:23S rRNA (guanosine2251-2'-O)-methyltransferase